MENFYFIDKKILYKEIGTIYFIALFHVSGNFGQFESYVYSTKSKISVEWVVEVVLFLGHCVDHYILGKNECFPNKWKKTYPVYPHIFANALTNWFCSLKTGDIYNIGNFRQHWKMLIIIWYKGEGILQTGFMISRKMTHILAIGIPRWLIYFKILLTGTKIW